MLKYLIHIEHSTVQTSIADCGYMISKFKKELI